MSTLTTRPKRGERRRIDHAECVWAGDRWARVDNLERRLRELDRVAKYNDRMGAPTLAKMRRAEAAHIRELLAEVAA